MRVGIGAAVWYGVFAGLGTKHEAQRVITGMSETTGQEGLELLESYIMGAA
jgi:hypothetical protein